MDIQWMRLAFSPNNTDLYHYRHQGRIIDISEHRTKIIALSILFGLLTPFLLGIGGYVLASHFLAAHYKWKKIEKMERQGNILTIDQTAQQILNGQCARPLEATGGIVNGGNTCYMAAILQTVKNSPFFWNYLDDSKRPFCRLVDETEEQFEKRKEIRQAIKDILLTSMRGETVQANAINNLRRLILQYQPGVLSAEGAGDPKEFWMLVCKILDMPDISLNPSSDIFVLDNCLFVMAEDFPHFQAKMQGIELNCPSPIIAFTVDGLDHAPIDPPMQISIPCNGQPLPVNYQLVSMIDCKGHAVAHLKNANGEWVLFDDNFTGKFANRPNEEERRNATLVFYRYSA
ncbi:hypothetical protein [Candidatus Protochlamydia phocaeensis]|uniref:hypothetical protein n=1 Tax=Candidatus Protochlamydia phocaeensis TaxID=1414722 RepID=UPI000838A72B|nr:hypothetical protein [Candidatus Protochlamydia phocaeensis]